MLPSAIDLLALDLPEALALRAVLELNQVRVNLFTVGRGTDVLSALNADAPHLVISAHGDDQGSVLPELDREAIPDDPFYGRLAPADVRRYAVVRDRLVLASACGSGSQAFADAFLNAGASGYLAPIETPKDALFFLVHFYYGLAWGRTLVEAVRWASDHDTEETRTFRLFLR
jgi:hypothetical protein